MDTENRKFFTALNRGKTININKIAVDDIIEAYDRLAREYNDFIRAQEYTKEGEKSKQVKRKFDRLFRYWIDPFNIALRNEIGATGIPKMQVERVTTDYGDKANLSIETIKKIRKKYDLDMEREKFSNISKDDLLKIIKDLLHIKPETLEKQEEKQKLPEHEKFEPYENPSAISTKYRLKSKEDLVNFMMDYLDYKIVESSNDRESEPLADKLRKIETYTFTTGIENQLQSFINQYELTLEYDGKKCSKKIYGDIHLKRFYTEPVYRRIVLEAIENLEIQNYRTKQKDKYIGSFESIVKEGKIEWQQILRDGDQDAIRKIEIMDERAKHEKITRNQKGAIR